MSAEEVDKSMVTDTSAEAGDEEEEWLYGDESETKEEEEAAAAAAAPVTVSVFPPPTVEEEATGNGVAKQDTAEDDEDTDSDSDDDDDDVRVTIGDIKTGAPQYAAYGGAPVNLNIKTAGRPYGAGKSKGIDLEAPGSINGVPLLEVDVDSFEDKPWRKPGADLSDYFNYGFNEDTWKAYCEKQKRLRMGLEVVTATSTSSKITVQQGRTGNAEKEVSLPAPKVDFTSPTNVFKPGIPTSRISPTHWSGGPACQDMSFYTNVPGTINVIGGQTATISRVEGRRRHNNESNNIQVIAEHSTSDADPAPAPTPAPAPAPAKLPPFFPPGALPPNIPPPPFLPPPPNVSSAPPLIPPPRIPITVPPPGFPPPPGAPPPSLIPTLDGGHAGNYDGRSVPPYPFNPGYPHLAGAVAPWPSIIDNSKQWEYYSRREKERDREKDRERERPRERGHERERERERDHSPTSMVYNSDEERFRYREYAERGYERHRERSSREKEDRHRERRHRDKEESRHKSSRSSSRRRHDSEEGDGHRRHKHKKSKRSKEGKEASDDHAPEQDHSEAAGLE
ncbi:pre-mRNA 3'-end-processing factor FIP1-like isoform X2 [Polyodon spathula]|uniref:pre-mRNA 3'-end-processing factor FIP1-like isoform X2 n=1 Tax=Polyodon spathula TaxID=7913 RepID=UPI001B7F5109|nr:pre-mRNA 3'-end-processing factor FIP1-like isoform X2 [Polyodon spathula]